MKKFLVSLSLLFFILVILSVSCKRHEQPSSIILATTTSTEDSGLLHYLLPEFKDDTGIEVRVIAVGTGKALQMGRDGEADVLLVHSKEAEEVFIREGHGKKRYNIMYNDFILIGPLKDPLNLKEISPQNIVEGLKIINQNQIRFISRGDDSGTHKKEMALWEIAGIEPEGEFYISAGRGMGDVLKIADEMQAYTITDRATFLNFRSELELKIIIENDKNLFNQYGIIAVNPDKNEYINEKGADIFISWMLSEKAQKMIGKYGIDIHDTALFTPNADK